MCTCRPQSLSVSMAFALLQGRRWRWTRPCRWAPGATRKLMRRGRLDSPPPASRAMPHASSGAAKRVTKHGRMMRAACSRWSRLLSSGDRRAPNGYAYMHVLHACVYGCADVCMYCIRGCVHIHAHSAPIHTRKHIPYATHTCTRPSIHTHTPPHLHAEQAGGALLDEQARCHAHQWCPVSAAAA